MNGHVERRLAAIMVADVVGYSRLMEADEAGVFARQRAHVAECLEPAIQQRRGRIVKHLGDGLLAEFQSIVDAVSAAVAIQRDMAAREVDRPESGRIRYRIGVNLGDVIVETDDLFGDGVNIAARLEALAVPGGICISGAAYDQMKSNLDVTYEALGAVAVKNIAEPVRAYRVHFDGALDAIRRAVGLAPADSLMRAYLGRLLSYAGEAEAGVGEVKAAMRMSPDSLPMLFFLGAAYRAAGRFDDAIAALEEHRTRLGDRIMPQPTAHLIASYAAAGREADARSLAQRLLTAAPGYSLEIPGRTPYREADAQAAFLDALTQAGIPKRPAAQTKPE